MNRNFRFKVTLDGIEPPIWRAFQTPDDLTFAELHSTLQIVMGWENAHLHQFSVGQLHFSDPVTAVEFNDKDEYRHRVADFVKPGDSIRYLYDFGDGWEHTVTLTAVVPEAESLPYSICLAGARACPPEDCGGVWGYADLLHALQHPDDPEHEELLEWYGGDLDPEAFDLDEVNAILRQ